MAMRRFAVIGLGRFGSRLAANLAAAGQEVIAIDVDRQIVEQMRDRATLAVAIDATDDQALRSQGVDQVDVAVVAIGNDFEASALATVLLKQIGVPHVIGRAVTPTSGQILARIGADEVVNPEDEAADRWCTRLVSPHFLSQHELDSRHRIVEVRVPPAWVGHTLRDLDPRMKLGLNVVAIRRAKHARAGDASQAPIDIPTPDEALLEADVIIVMGRDADLSKLGDDSE